MCLLYVIRYRFYCGNAYATSIEPFSFSFGARPLLVENATY